MTPLRAAMIKAMQMHGFSERTHQSYLAAVTDLARYTKRSPDRLSPPEVNEYFEYLVTERKLAPASCRLFFKIGNDGEQWHNRRFATLIVERPDIEIRLITIQSVDHIAQERNVISDRGRRTFTAAWQ